MTNPIEQAIERAKLTLADQKDLHGKFAALTVEEVRSGKLLDIFLDAAHARAVSVLLWGVVRLIDSLGATNPQGQGYDITADVLARMLDSAGIEELKVGP